MLGSQAINPVNPIPAYEPLTVIDFIEAPKEA